MTTTVIIIFVRYYKSVDMVGKCFLISLCLPLYRMDRAVRRLCSVKKAM